MSFLPSWRTSHHQLFEGCNWHEIQLEQLNKSSNYKVGSMASEPAPKSLKVTPGQVRRAWMNGAPKALKKLNIIYLTPLQHSIICSLVCGWASQPGRVDINVGRIQMDSCRICVNGRLTLGADLVCQRPCLRALSFCDSITLKFMRHSWIGGKPERKKVINHSVNNYQPAL